MARMLVPLLCGMCLAGLPRLAAADSFAAYGWTVSSSPDDPFHTEGDLPTSTLSLWLQCSAGSGIAAAQFELVAPPGTTVVSFAPRSGFLNGGTARQLQLAVGGCPYGPVLAGIWTLSGATPGSYCLAATHPSGMILTVDCDSADPGLHDGAQVGYGAGAPPACDERGLLCHTTAVSPRTWGGVKASYR